MKKFLIVFVGVLLLASAAQSAPIKSITATTVGTAFSSLTGILTMNGITGIDVQDMADIVTTTSGGSFSLTTNLTTDLSSGGIAKAAFTGGNFSIKDAAAVVMLSGTISSFQLIEIYNGSGIFAGDGAFTVTGGTLASGFGTPTGTLVDISFSVAPKTISNFSTGFTASSTMTVLPIPEPATMALLIPAILALRKRNSK
jgi:hypothetical protein